MKINTSVHYISQLSYDEGYVIDEGDEFLHSRNDDVDATQNRDYSENPENVEFAQEPVDVQEGANNAIPVPDDPESDHDILELEMADIQDKFRRPDSNDPGWKYGILDDPKMDKHSVKCVLCSLVSIGGVA